MKSTVLFVLLLLCVGFGVAVGVSDNTVLVGATGKSDVAPFAGAAYVYEF